MAAAGNCIGGKERAADSSNTPELVTLPRSRTTPASTASTPVLWLVKIVPMFVVLLPDATVLSNSPALSKIPVPVF